MTFYGMGGTHILYISTVYIMHADSTSYPIKVNPRSVTEDHGTNTSLVPLIRPAAETVPLQDCVCMSVGGEVANFKYITVSVQISVQSFNYS